MTKNIIIAIDGPAGSGKSTTAKLVADKLGFTYIDTGAMYRAVTFLAMERGIINDEEKIIKMCEEINISLVTSSGDTQVFVDGRELTHDIRSIEVNDNVSYISKIDGVRKELVKKQREIGKGGNVVMEGRDIGTVVFPNADVKIYLTAGLDQRTERRVKQLAEDNNNISPEVIKENLLKRDKIDSTRSVSPLVKSEDAVELDTSFLTVEEQVNKIIEQVNSLKS